MTLIDAAQLLDFVSSIAVLGLLVIGFSAVGPALKVGRVGPLVQGGFFGLVVSLQMSMPLSPAEGVIVDMRNVPIVLAGAFLGLRGLLVCLCIAVGTRIGVGGVGMASGVAGMLIAGAVGFAWSRFAPSRISHDWLRLTLLGVLVNLHMLAAFILPPDITTWFFYEAATTILMLNLLSVPTIGWLLMREQHRDAAHARLAAAAQLDPSTRLLSLDGFAHEVSHFDASNPDNRIEGVIAITLKNARWLRQTWGDDAVDKTLGALRIRVNRLWPDTRPLGIDARRRLLVPITRSEMQDLRPLRMSLRQLATKTPFVLDGNVEVPASILMENFRLHHPELPAATLRDVNRSGSERRAKPRPRVKSTRTPLVHHSEIPLPEGLSLSTMGRLFDVADAGLKRSA